MTEPAERAALVSVVVGPDRVRVSGADDPAGGHAAARATLVALKCPECGGRKSVAAQRCLVCSRRATQVAPPARAVGTPLAERAVCAFRQYCLMCGRSSDVAIAQA